MRSPNSSASASVHAPVSDPPASPCTFWGTCAYAHSVSVPAGERDGSARPICPTTISGLDGITPHASSAL